LVTEKPGSGVDPAVALRVSEQSERLKQRTRRFALDVLELIKLLPRDEPGPTVKRQLTKAATSVDMNYRAACRARSHDEFTHELEAIFSASAGTARRRARSRAGT
jgi:hypothetical protein